MRPRRIASPVSVVLASISVVAALVAGYARVALLDSNQFADRATRGLMRVADTLNGVRKPR